MFETIITGKCVSSSVDLTKMILKSVKDLMGHRPLLKLQLVEENRVAVRGSTKSVISDVEKLFQFVDDFMSQCPPVMYNSIMPTFTKCLRKVIDGFEVEKDMFFVIRPECIFEKFGCTITKSDEGGFLIKGSDLMIQSLKNAFNEESKDVLFDENANDKISMNNDNVFVLQDELMTFLQSNTDVVMYASGSSTNEWIFSGNEESRVKLQELVEQLLRHDISAQLTKNSQTFNLLDVLGKAVEEANFPRIKIDTIQIEGKTVIRILGSSKEFESVIMKFKAILEHEVNMVKEKEEEKEEEEEEEESDTRNFPILLIRACWKEIEKLAAKNGFQASISLPYTLPITTQRTSIDITDSKNMEQDVKDLNSLLKLYGRCSVPCCISDKVLSKFPNIQSYYDGENTVLFGKLTDLEVIKEMKHSDVKFPTLDIHDGFFATYSGSIFAICSKHGVKVEPFVKVDVVHPNHMNRIRLKPSKGIPLSEAEVAKSEIQRFFSFKLMRCTIVPREAHVPKTLREALMLDTSTGFPHVDLKIVVGPSHKGLISHKKKCKACVMDNFLEFTKSFPLVSLIESTKPRKSETNKKHMVVKTKRNRYQKVIESEKTATNAALKIMSMFDNRVKLLQRFVLNSSDLKILSFEPQENGNLLIDFLSSTDLNIQSFSFEDNLDIQYDVLRFEETNQNCEKQLSIWIKEREYKNNYLKIKREGKLFTAHCYEGLVTAFNGHNAFIVYTSQPMPEHRPNDMKYSYSLAEMKAIMRPLGMKSHISLHFNPIEVDKNRNRSTLQNDDEDAFEAEMSKMNNIFTTNAEEEDNDVQKMREAMKSVHLDEFEQEQQQQQNQLQNQNQDQQQQQQQQHQKDQQQQQQQQQDTVESTLSEEENELQKMREIMQNIHIDELPEKQQELSELILIGEEGEDSESTLCEAYEHKESDYNHIETETENDRNRTSYMSNTTIDEEKDDENEEEQILFLNARVASKVKDTNKKSDSVEVFIPFIEDSNNQNNDSNSIITKFIINSREYRERVQEFYSSQYPGSSICFEYGQFGVKISSKFIESEKMNIHDDFFKSINVTKKDITEYPESRQTQLKGLTSLAEFNVNHLKFSLRLIQSSNQFLFFVTSDNDENIAVCVSNDGHNNA